MTMLGKTSLVFLLDMNKETSDGPCERFILRPKSYYIMLLKTEAEENIRDTDGDSKCWDLKIKLVAV